MTSDGSLIHVDQPDNIQTTSGILMFGSTLVWPPDRLMHDSAAVRAILSSNAPRAGIITDMRGQVRAFLPMPAGVDRMRQVQALADEHGTVHVIWGSTGADTSMNAAVTSLWYAQFSRGAWTAPEKALSADWIYNGRTTVSIRARDRRVHVAALTTTQQDSAPSQDVVQYARRDEDGRWTSQQLDLGPHGARVRHVAMLGPFSGNHLAIAFTGQVRARPGRAGLHGLYVLHSRDGGGTWQLPELVRELPITSGYALGVAPAPHGVATLVWLTRVLPADGQFATGQRVHFLQTSDGRTWRDLPDLDAPIDVTDRIPVVATSEELLVLGIARGTRRLFVWRQGDTSLDTWLPPDSVTLTADPIMPTLSRLSPTAFSVTWQTPHLVAIHGGPVARVPATHFAIYRSCPSTP